MSFDDASGVRIENDVRNTDVLADEIDRVLEVVDSGLNALSPPLGTAREFRHGERELCKLGLEIAKLVFQRLGAGHNKPPF